MKKTMIASVLASVLTFPAIADDNAGELPATPEQKLAQCQPFKLVHQQAEITIDGKMDEPIWKNATRIDLKYENKPGEGIPAKVKTQAYLFEDGKNLYVAIKAFDPDPSSIRASFRDRDQVFADDNVGIIIDTFNDQRTGYEFFVNPLGAQADMRMTDNNGWREDSSWDAIWDSAGEITDQGFVVEMSIPFSALRFPESDNGLTWNIALWRNYSRDVHRQMANVPLDRNLGCSLCQFDQLTGFEQIEPSTNFQITPTLTASRSDEKPDVPGDWQNGDVDVEPGVDLRWAVTQDSVLNATINPDFSQVEADASQLDVNSTFSLFFPEKRPFFLDGATYFKTDEFNLLHTRNIAEPDYGLKLTGKSDEHSYGVMVANDTATRFILPGTESSSLAEYDEKSTIAVARYKQDIGERNSIGALVTNRSATDYRNTVASVDGNYWFSDADQITYQLVHSDSRTPDSIVNDDDYSDLDVKPEQQGNALRLNYRRSTRDYVLRGGYTNISKGFRADLGFQSQVNFEKVVLGGRRTWYGDKDDIFTRWGVFGDWDKTFDQDGNVLEEEYELHGNLQGPMQLFTNFGGVHRNKRYNDQYFNENQVQMWAEFRPFDPVEFSLWTRYGSQIDYANTQLGTIFAFVPRMQWDVNKHIKINLKHDYTRLNVDSGRLFTANLTDLRFSYQFDMRSIVKFVVQYNDVERNPENYDDEVDKRNRSFSTQLIYSYKINPQSLVFVGYSDGGYQDDDLTKLERDQRTVFAKFSYAWQL